MLNGFNRFLTPFCTGNSHNANDCLRTLNFLNLGLLSLVTDHSNTSLPNFFNTLRIFSETSIFRIFLVVCKYST